MSVVKVCEEGLAIPFDAIFAYGVYDGTPETRNEVVAAMTWVTPMTWVAKKSKLMFFDRHKNDLASEHIKCRSKNANFFIKEGECWVAFREEIPVDDGLVKCHGGLAVITKEQLKAIMTYDIRNDDNFKEVAVVIGEDGNIKDILYGDDVDPRLLEKTVDEFIEHDLGNM